MVRVLFSKVMSTSRNVTLLSEMDQVSWTTRNWFSCSRNVLRLVSKCHTLSIMYLCSMYLCINPLSIMYLCINPLSIQILSYVYYLFLYVFIHPFQLIKNITSKAYAEDIRKRIKDNTTHDNPSYYGAVFYNQEDHGTSHVSILASNGDAVSVTSTVNL